MVPYVVGEVVPLPPERELRAQWEDIARIRWGVSTSAEVKDLESDFARQTGQEYLVVGSGIRTYEHVRTWRMRRFRSIPGQHPLYHSGDAYTEAIPVPRLVLRPFRASPDGRRP